MVTPVDILNAYANGIFPMADSADGKVQWYSAVQRGIIPITAAHIPRRLRRTVLGQRFTASINTCFDDVIRACAAPRSGEKGTWINHDIIGWFNELHSLGFAHSIEVWENGALAGGLYGVAIGGAFCGESMFSRTRNASKVALVHTLARLHHKGFALFDTQFITPHLAQFGAIEVPHDDYIELLGPALNITASFTDASDLPATEVVRSYLSK